AFDLASPVLEQLVAAELVPHTAAVAAERRQTLTAARDHLLRRLAERIPDWYAAPPPGGLALWVDLGAPLSSVLTIAAERHGVALAAGPRFGLDGAFERYLRLPYTLDVDVLDTAVDRLAAVYAGLAHEPAGPPSVRDVA
ncbi:MAG TPA: PLP-dependent aminotransferase family protein, partial [Cryptosporangiaceae bacterium]|nr:PLP-dependent aminotransferase family protein [Cryptosporangiaceae bacterium]